MPLDSIEEVRLFRQIAASGSLSAAARTLGDNKNRVSQRLSALERSLGVRLAERTTRTFKLTEEGERFLLASEGFLEAAERMEATLQKEDVLDGRVRIAIRSTYLGVGLGDEIARLLISAPRLRLQVTLLDNDADLPSLQAQGLDLAIQVGKLKDSALIARRLGEVKFAMCASPAYVRAHGRPKKPADLAAHECIRRLGTPPETTWALVGPGGKKVRAPISGRFECSDARFQTEVLYGGWGIGLRPSAEVRRGIEAGTLERVLPTFSLESIPVWLVSPKGRLRIPRVARVAQVLEKLVATLAE